MKKYILRLGMLAFIGLMSISLVSCPNPADELPSFSVTYDANGAVSGTVPIDSGLYKTAGSVTVLDNTGSLSIPDYSFTVWNTKKDGSGTPYKPGEIFAMPSENVLLYAQWTPVYYELTFDGNEAVTGTTPAAGKYTSGSKIKLPSNTGSLTKTNCTFAGWNTKKDGSGTLYEVETEFIMPSSAATLYAHWTTIEYFTLTYDGNDATGGSVPSAAQYTGGSIVSLPGNTGSLVKTGYSFYGWNTKKDGSGTLYTAGTQYTMPSLSTTLYAHWVVTRTITFNANGGTGTMTSLAAYENIPVTLRKNTFTHPSASFSGWAASASASTAQYTDMAQITATSTDITLYAVWKPWFSYTVSGTNAVITGFAANWNETPALVIPSSIDGNTVTGIADDAFRDNLTITSAVIPDTVTSLGQGAFYGCKKLISADLGHSIKKINQYTFQSCEKLTSIIIPGSAASIESQAFAWCLDLSSVTLENGITSIGNNAFYESDLLTAVALPASITTLHENFITYCNNLASITVDPANTVYSSDNGVLYNKAKTKLIKCPQGKSGNLTIISGVSEIGAYSISGCPLLTGINLPTSLLTLGNYAFYGCTGITNITLPNSLTSIGLGVFGECSVITITIPASVTAISGGAFQDCTLLTSITVTTGNTKYSASSGILFNNDSTSLICYPAGKTGTSYTIPSTVTTIAAYAFEDAKPALVTIPSSVSTIETFAFREAKLTSITVPSSVTSIGNYAFTGCSSASSITVEASTPPAAGYTIFPNNSISISVPSASVASYKAASNWSNYSSRIIGY